VNPPSGSPPGLTPLPAAERPAALRAVDVSKRYGDSQALDHVSVDVAPGECLALIGESGSGKTTLLRMFNRMVEPDSGEVLLDGRSASTRDPVELRRATGYVPQDGGLLPHWRVRRNVALVPWLLGSPTPDADLSADEMLALVGLDPAAFGHRWPRGLSGGQRQRVAIARALAGHPAVMLLDEPFSALDAITRLELQTSFRTLRERVSVTALLVTHDVREALALGDRVAVLRRGRLEQVGTPAELRAHADTPYVAALLALAMGN
jgi:osmoprotectant transport system ATP-binding protein